MDAQKSWIGEAVASLWKLDRAPIVLYESVRSNSNLRSALHKNHAEVFADTQSKTDENIELRKQQAQTIKNLESIGLKGSGRGLRVHRGDEYFVDENNRRLLAISEGLGGVEVYKTKDEKAGTLSDVVTSEYRRQSMEGALPIKNSFQLVHAVGPVGGTDKGTGLGAGVWVEKGSNGQPQTMALFYAGSERGIDWLHDGANLAGLETSQYKAGIEFARSELKKLSALDPSKRPTELLLGGHSLGGGIALQAYGDPENYELIKKLRAEGMTIEVVTRNPACLPFTMANRYAETIGQEGAAHIHNFVNKGELVSSTGALPGHIVENGKGLWEASRLKGLNAEVAVRNAGDQPLKALGIEKKGVLGKALHVYKDATLGLYGTLANPLMTVWSYGVGKVTRHMEGDLQEVSKKASQNARVTERKLRENAQEPKSCTTTPYKVAYDERFGTTSVTNPNARNEALESLLQIKGAFHLKDSARGVPYSGEEVVSEGDPTLTARGPSTEKSVVNLPPLQKSQIKTWRSNKNGPLERLAQDDLGSAPKV